MKYLFIVTEAESANGICAKAVMRQLSQDNEVYCITNREYGSPGVYEEASVKYFTVKPRLVYRLSSRMAYGNLSGVESKVYRLAYAAMNKAKLLLTVGMWPLISPAYANRIYRLAKKLCAEHGVDCIVPIYTQIDTLIAANRVKKRMPHIKYIPYFLDALSGGYGPRYFSENRIRSRGLRWEHRLLPLADRIIAMQSSYPHHKRYSADAPYYERISFFDLPLLNPPAEAEAPQRLMDPQKINLAYVGTLPGGIRSPAYILRVFSRLQGEQWQLYFVGDSACKLLQTAAKTDERIHIVGRCDHATAMQYEMQADALVNIGNTNPNMTPSKIFEYMSIKKPIVSTAAIEDEPSKQYLRRYPAALILDENDQNVQSAAEQLEGFVSAYRGAILDGEEIRRTFYQNTPEAVAVFLRSVNGINECSTD